MNSILDIKQSLTYIEGCIKEDNKEKALKEISDLKQYLDKLDIILASIVETEKDLFGMVNRLDSKFEKV